MKPKTSTNYLSQARQAYQMRVHLEKETQKLIKKMKKLGYTVTQIGDETHFVKKGRAE